MDKNKPKVIVIGLDGATFRNLRPWMEQGLLPNLKFLVDNGASGELESTIPRLSSAAWASFMTGVNPGKHGLFGFVKPFKDKTYSRELVDSRDIKAKTIFEILSENNKTSEVVNLPITYPPFKINGFMISCGLTTPSTDFNFTHPEDLFEKAGLKKSEYVLDVTPRNYLENEKEKFFIDLIKETEKKKEISFKLIKSYDWDLFVLVFGGLDRFQHFFWHYIDPSHSKYNPKDAKRVLPLIIKYCQKLDSIIDEFISYMDKSTSLFIMSDHGFGPWEKSIALHKILEENKLLYCKADPVLERIGKSIKKFRGTLHRHSSIYRKAKGLIKLIYPKIKGSDFEKKVDKLNVERRLGARDNSYWQRIKWQKTIAYLGNTEDTVLLNLKGREPEGIVNPDGEYQHKRDQIIDLISNLYEPELKRKLNVKVYKREEICHGPHSQNAYDLYFEIENGRYVLQSAAYSKNIFIESKEWTGRHTKDGIIICYGKNFKKAHKIEDAQIIDLAPTILYLLKDKIPEYMDGKVLKDAFKNNYLGQNPIQHQKSLTEEQETRREYSAYSQEDGNKIKQRLADLGYI